MRRDGWILLFGTVMTAVNSYAATDHAMDPIDVPRLEGVVIDGAANDWGNRGFRVEVMADDRGRHRPPKDFDPRLRIGWDDRGLLILAEVTDDDAQEYDIQRRMFLADSIELFIGSKRGVHDYYMLLIGPGWDVNHPEPRHVFFDERGGGPVEAEGLAPLEATIARARTDDGYRIEALLPWTNLELEPKPGLTFAFQMYAMDKDTDEDVFRVAWFPAFDTHQNQTTSMYALRLADEPADPIQATVGGRFRDIAVTAVEAYDGKRVAVMRDEKVLIDGTLIAVDGRATASLKLPAPRGGSRVGDVNVYIDGLLVAKTSRGAPAAMLSQAMKEGNLRFYQHIFSGSTFPRVEFEDPRTVKALVGKSNIQTRFFNADFEEMTTASVPGRYGAVVEVTPEHGRLTRRFFTLYRTTDDESVQTLAVPPWIMPDLGTIELPSGIVLNTADEAKLAGVGDDLNEAAAILRLSPDVDPDGSASADAAAASISDQRWWVRLRRGLYGLDGKPAVLPTPRPISGATATTLRDGTPGEACLDSAVIGELEAICGEWMKSNKNQGVSVCVARHGVIFFHRAYGKTRKGEPMTVTTPSVLHSLTKMITGVMLMMYVDWGLIDLDAPLDTYIPALREVNVTTPMTHRMLVTHTSGLEGHYGDEYRDLEERIADTYAFVEVPVTHKYNSVGYALSVKALETISGEPFEVLYHRLLFEPLGMENTTIRDSYATAISTAGDMAKFGQMLLNGGAYGNKRFFAEETWEQALPTRLTMVLGEDTQQAWGIGIWGNKGKDRHLDQTAYGHPSANSAYLRVDTATDLVLAVSGVEKGKSFRGELRTRFIQAIEQNINDRPPIAQGDGS